MFNRPEIMRMAQELAGHASARQAEIARNVANADTPGYRARDLTDFAQVWDEHQGAELHATRAGHVTAAGPAAAAQVVIDEASEPSPNGNSVSIEREIMKGTEVRNTHDMALAVYKTSLDMMRTVVGRR